MAAGTYSATITDAVGHQVLVSSVTVGEGNDFALRSDTLVCAGDTLALFLTVPPNASMTYISPSDGLICSPCVPPFDVAPLRDAYYEVKMEDATCTYLDFAVIEADTICTWPGDTDTNKVVNHFDLLNIGLAHGSNGPVRPNASLNWSAQPGPYWLEETPNTNVNYKHIDTDGNGQINDLDTMALVQNWGEMHNLNGGSGNQKLPEIPVQLGSAGTIPFYIATDTMEENMQYDLQIILGEAGNPVSGAYGLAFTLTYAGDIVVPGSARVGFTPSWLGLPDDLLFVQRGRWVEGKVDVAVTRRDGQGVDGFGQIGVFSITIEDDIFFNGGGSDRFLNDEEFELGIENVRLISVEEEEILTNPSSTRMLVGDGTTGTRDLAWQQELEIFPNPVSKDLHIQSPRLAMEKITLFHSTGEKIEEYRKVGQAFTWSRADLPNGTYWLQIETAEGVLIEKLSLIH